MLFTHRVLIVRYIYTIHYTLSYILYTIYYIIYTLHTTYEYAYTIHIIGIANTVRKAITLGLSFALFPERNVLTLHHIIGASVFIFGLVLRMVLKENSQWLNTLEMRILRFTTRMSISFMYSGHGVGTGVGSGVSKGVGGRCRHDSNILTEDDDTTSTSYNNNDILGNGGHNYDSLIEIEQGPVTDYGAPNGKIS